MSLRSNFSILTVGHSTHNFDRFASILSASGVTALADVRTSPFSQHTPHFNRDALKASLKYPGIAYVFMGKELGGRPQDEYFYTSGIADYEKMAEDPLFRAGIERLIAGITEHRIVLMCSEKDPLDCHRCLLVSRALSGRGASVGHILHSGHIAAHEQIEDELLKKEGLAATDFFSDRGERLAAAYRERARKVAFSTHQQIAKSPAR